MLFGGSNQILVCCSRAVPKSAAWYTSERSAVMEGARTAETGLAAGFK